MKLIDIHDKLLDRYGPRRWWPTTLPGDSEPTYHGQPLNDARRFEMAIGAILTQNTNWSNVKKALRNLRKARLTSPRRIAAVSHEKLAELIRPSGYYRLKAERLQNLTQWWIDSILDQSLPTANRLDEWRSSLLGVKGVGRETADSILLYAFELPTFVIDAYTKRVMARHHGTPADINYETLRSMFMNELPADVALYNEFHALFVQVGKESCRPRTCLEDCPLRTSD